MMISLQLLQAGVANLLDLSLGDSMVLMGQGFPGHDCCRIYKVGGIVEFNLPEQNNTWYTFP
jgi:hypothetical protein